MKRLTPRFRRWLANRQRRGCRKSDRRRQFARRNKELREIAAEFGLQRAPRTRGRAVLVLSAPKILCLNDAHGDVVQFLGTMRRAIGRCISRRIPLEIDFRTIERITPAAALCLSAELDRWQRTNRVRLTPSGLKEWRQTVLHALNAMGFFDLLDLQGTDGDLQELQADDHAGTQQRTIPFKSGIESDGELAVSLKKEFDRLDAPVDDSQMLFIALIEAMNNALQHAYPAPPGANELDDPNSRIDRRWWLGGSVDVESQRIKVVFLDQGVGIPTTLPRSQWSSRLPALLQGIAGGVEDHGMLINAAMEVGRTRTGQPGRGLGMAQLRDLAASGEDNILRIFSNRGSYRFNKVEGTTITQCADSLEGTLIEWDLAIGKTRGEDHDDH